MSKIGLAAVLVAAGMAVSAGAEAASVRYSSAWFFGDSLSDPGNLFAATGGAIPSAPYFQGRTSNGPVWAEHVAADFAAKGRPTGNFAFAFATAAGNDDVALGRPLQIPDLADQIGAFRATPKGELGRRPVASLWFGSNDVFDAINTGPTPENVAAAATGAANAVADGVKRLTRLGSATSWCSTCRPCSRRRPSTCSIPRRRRWPRSDRTPSTPPLPAGSPG